MPRTSLRIHPSIGIARVGNSEEYYLGPETMAGMPIGDSTIRGGLPIKPGTEDTPINSADLRDRAGRLKRQAARFRIYQYTDGTTPEEYPHGGGAEVTIDSSIDGKRVEDIVWTVHLANKKANGWRTEGQVDFEGGKTPPLRNAWFNGSTGPANPDRLRHLVIDAGPRAIRASDRTGVEFDKETGASYWDTKAGVIQHLSAYPKSFPASDPPESWLPSSPASSEAITTLGALYTEPNGRLLVVGGYGRASAFDENGLWAPYSPLDRDVNNDRWLDDTSDGPVSATLIFADGSEPRSVDGNAWVIATDPAYAPQTTNVVTLWDDLYCTWVEQLELQPSLFTNGKYHPGFEPYFPRDIKPILTAASLQKWNISLPPKAVAAHEKLGDMRANNFGDMMIMNFIREPENADQQAIGNKRMPLSLGEPGKLPGKLGKVVKNFLSVTTTQYFFLQRWADGKYNDVEPPMPGPGEALDKTILFNCLGGRFSPGIEMTFIVRDPYLYRRDWRSSNSGPFRINQQPLDYSSATRKQPFLGVGYIPFRENPAQVQPGDLSKFMAIPWHTDYNSCATHVVAAEKENHLVVDNLLYASWPAQRPVAVYTYDDVQANEGRLTRPRFSVRGAGTASPNAANVGRYQNRVDILLNWSRIGVVMQGPTIVGYPAPGPDSPPSYGTDFFLEVESRFDNDESNLAEYWPNTVIDWLYPPLPRRKPLPKQEP
jgi:hypothetical protein